MPTLGLVWPLLRVVQRCRSPENAGQRGTGSHYSNIDLEVLGLVIEKATGQALPLPGPRPALNWAGRG